MDYGTAIAVVGTSFAIMGAIIGISKTVFAKDKDWHQPLVRVEEKFNNEIDSLKERIHSVEASYETIKHLTASLQEIKEMIRKLEKEEREDILKLESKIEKLGDLILKSLQQD